MSQDSTQKPRRRKATDRPKKPYAKFPLTPHASGKWMKKILGKIHYFGNWAKRVEGKLVRVDGDGWKDALAAYEEQANDLHAGRTPRVKGDELTIADLCNRFLTAKLRKQEAGELGQRQFVDYKEATDLIVRAFGRTRPVDDIAAEDFEALRATMAKRWGPVRLANAITRIKSVFKYGMDNNLITKTVRYGSEFKKPDKGVLRRHRARHGEKMFEPEQIRQLLGYPPWALSADSQLRGMILLGVNCGLGNNDIATLPLNAVDLHAGWIDFPRPKTGIPRRCPLWPETVSVLRQVIDERPEPKNADVADLVFINSRGSAWVVTTEKSRTDGVSVHFMNALKACGLYRPGLGFYTLRHVFRTIADGARDDTATDIIMGHSDPSMAGHYRERVEDSRLMAVVNHVHNWLFPPA
jgi:integrase